MLRCQSSEKLFGVIVFRPGNRVGGEKEEKEKEEKDANGGTPGPTREQIMTLHKRVPLPGIVLGILK